MKSHQLKLLRSLIFESPTNICTNCAARTRQFHALRPLRQRVQPQGTSEPRQRPPPPSQTQQSPNAQRPPPPSEQIHRQDNRYPTTPSGHWKHPGYIEPLGRPIGHPEPPSIHDNAPVDTRDLSQRYKDFTSKEKNLENRQKIKSALSRPGFRDWKNLKFQSGKLWLANEKLWKQEMSLWMPNMVGPTLAGDSYKTTTEALRGQVSLVALYQRDWAQKQAESWFSPKANPKVAAMIEEGKLNLVCLNVEDATLHRWIQKTFLWVMRRSSSKKKQENTFLMSSVPDNVVQEIGLLNMRVGYVYLVDRECKIRWAGCGDANPDELASLSNGAERLIKQGTAGAIPT